MANNISVLENGKKQFIVVKIGSEQYHHCAYAENYQGTQGTALF